LALEGEVDEATQIRRDLGLGLRDCPGQDQQKGTGNGRWDK